MNKVVFGALTLASLAIGSSAHAVLITFNSVASTETIQTYVTDGDYEFSSDHFHTYGDAPYFPGTVWNGTTHIGYESGRGAAIQMRRLDGAAFSLIGLDVSEFYSVANLDRPNANILDIQGTLLAGGVVSYQLFLDGIFDGRGGLADFQSFELAGLFSHVTSVLFTGLTYSGESGGVALDNISVSVPEPATVLLFGAGLLMIGFGRRQKRAR